VVAKAQAVLSETALLRAMRLRTTDSEGSAYLWYWGDTNMRELFPRHNLVGVGFYFLFDHEKFMTMVGWLARLVR
jgi:hypothetical protein